MEEEATEEFVAIEVHDLDAVAVGVVAPAEADTAIGDGDEPLVGDGDTVRVAAEIGEYMFGAGEGRLAVDDPGVLAQLGEPRGPRRRLRESREAAREVQLAAIEGALQASEKPAAEDFGEGADREEEAGPRGNPTRALRRERAPGDDAVDVDVLREGLPPGVEHRGHTEVTAKMARIATEARQRGRGGVKEQPIDQAGVTLGEWVEVVRERKDDVEVRNRQDLAPARAEPALGRHALAFRAVAIPTGVVGDALGPARGADGPMAAEGGRAASRNGA